jgi:hypothetical protein
MKRWKLSAGKLWLIILTVRTFMVIVKVDVVGEMLLVYSGRSARNNTSDCIGIVDSAISWS